MARSDVFLACFALVGATALAQSPPFVPPEFRLGPGDVIQIHVIDDEDISDKPVRLGVDGFVNLPQVGHVKVAGLSVEELQSELTNRLKLLIVNPDVSVSVVETHSQPVSVLGAVKTPGIIQLQGHKTLIEVMSLAGGPTDDAGYIARITRQKDSGPLPLANAQADSTGEYSVAEFNLQKVMDNRDPGGNIQILPNDVISVPKAEMVYVLGEVLKPGSIVLGDQKTLTVLQAVSIANGMSKTAKASDAKILRVTPGSTSRTELAVNLKTMFAGKSDDVPLKPDDILYVPNSLKKDVGLKTIEALGGAGVSSIIYRIP